MARSAIRLGELAAEFGCELIGDPQVKVSRVATLSSAAEGTLSFFANKAYRHQLLAMTAGVVLVRAADADACPVNALIADDPYLVFARIAGLLHPQADVVAGSHASAVVSSSATIAANVQLSAHTLIDDDAIIEADVFVGPGVIVGPRCRIGKGSRLLANVTIVQDADIGERCIIHPGAVIGSDGFGNAHGERGWVKVPQVGRVLIGNDVEIGANTTIDRGALDDTVIADGVRLDNLVHIAHNVRIGQHTALAAQNGISGSTTIGKRCLFGGQVGVDGHLHICDDVIVSGKSVLTKDIKEPGYYAGTFAAEKGRDWKRKVARFRRLERLVNRVQVLEKMTSRDDQS